MNPSAPPFFDSDESENGMGSSTNYDELEEKER